jgi:hypothetical protein
MAEQGMVTRDSSHITSGDRAGDESHMAAVVLGHEPPLCSRRGVDRSCVLIEIAEDLSMTS